MYQEFTIEYRLPNGGEIKKRIDFIGTEEEVFDYTRKQSLELMKTHNIRQIQWKVNIGFKTVCGGIYAPQVPV